MKDLAGNEEFTRPSGWAAHLFLGSNDPTYRLVVWAFALGSFAHLWLADAAQPEWMPANIVYALGVVLLLATRGAMGWALCAVGLAIPLFFLRDQLTQSLILLLISLAGVATMLLDAGRTKDEPTKIFLATFRGITLVTYGLATFHKINRDFLNAETSCANYGVAELVEYFRLPSGFIPGELEALIPIGALALEGGIFMAYLLHRHRLAWLLAAVFHIPITLTMAPAFAFVMLGGHLSYMTSVDRSALLDIFRSRGRILVSLALALTALSLTIHGALPEVTMIPKEAALWLFLLWLWSAFPIWRLGSDGPWASHDQAPGPATAWGRGLVGAVVAIFVVNGFTPYLGVQYQHAGAMLSNLRIDEGCWNSYVVPESLRVREDYVRIEEGWFGEPGRLEEYETIMAEQLWNPPQIRQMRRNWCKNTPRPLFIAGTYRGRRFEISDLCAPETEWPFADDGIFDVELFPDFLRFQKNLMRECPQTCIH